MTAQLHVVHPGSGIPMLSLVRRSSAAFLLAACTVLALASPSAAYEKAIWGPPTFDGVSQFPIYKDLGVDVYQLQLSWKVSAPRRPTDARDPSDEAYTWDPAIDQAVAEATRNGIRVALMLLRTPAWANGERADNVPPTVTSDYADFAEAAARRYPAVKRFLVWGEPIRSPNYAVSPGPAAPNYYVDQRGPGRQRLPVLSTRQRADAQRYARLVDAVYARLKAIDRAYKIIGGNTTTSGEIDPFNWIRWMRLPNGAPPRMDMFGHNPFGTRGPDLKKDQIKAGTADFSDFDVLIPWIDRYMARSGRNRRLPIFVSEFTAPTDVPSFEFPFYVTREVQAKWLTAAFNIAKRSRRIQTVGWIGLRDPEPRPDGGETRTGLIDAQDRRKPAYYAFKRG